MKIHNFRIGFATNSSSSHSVVMIPPEMIGQVSYIDAMDGSDGYGWGFFRLVSEEQKLRYLAAQMFSNLRGENKRIMEVAERIDREVPGYAKEIGAILAKGNNDFDLPYVDHQSVYCFDRISPKIVEALIDFFKSPRVVVLGGNDNSMDHDFHKPEGANDFAAFNSLMTDGGGVRVKIDGHYWAFFNPENGTKSRFSLDEAVPDYIKSSTPELVDLKITDYCTRGCKFCYQSSTDAGVHADFDEIVRVLDMLQAMEVFEVAIGGGEPTEHPRFIDILRAATARQIKPNFTTLSDKWLDNEEIVQAVKEHVGGVGVSCSDKKALSLVEDVKQALDGCGWRPPFVTAQHVVGAVPVPVTAEFLEAAFDQRVGVLLLGYKEVGFGAEYQRHDDQHTPLVLKLAMDQATERRHYPQLSVDTALVDQYPEFIEALGVPNALVTSPEGKFSCYVDAVEGLMGPSSYIEKSAMTRVATDVEAFKRVYADY